MIENRVKLVKGAQMKITYAAALSLFLAATPALAEDESQPVTSNGVAFTCVLEGYSASLGRNDGNKIVYTSAKASDNCDATCTVTKRDNSTYSKSFSHGVSKGVTPDTRAYFDGESGLKGAPLSNPTMTSASCSWPRWGETNARLLDFDLGYPRGLPDCHVVERRNGAGHPRRKLQNTISGLVSRWAAAEITLAGKLVPIVDELAQKQAIPNPTDAELPHS
jgi:hypothetical protein